MMPRGLLLSSLRAYNGLALVNSQRTGLEARNKKARSRLKTVHAAFSVFARSMAPLWAGHAGGLRPCRFLLSGLPTCMCPPTPFGSGAAVRNRKEGVCHDW
ncbi:hypothetical protein ECAE60S_00242 [Eoetvoesiella caeni]